MQVVYIYFYVYDKLFISSIIHQMLFSYIKTEKKLLLHMESEANLNF